MTTEKDVKINVLLQDKENLIPTILELKEEVTLLISNLEGMIKSVLMLNRGFDILGEILEVGKVARDMKGVGFNYSSMNAKNKFVPPK